MTSWALRPWPRPRRPPFGNPPSTVPWTRTMRPRTSTIEGCMRGVGLGRNYTCTICVSQKERWLTLEVHCHLDPRVLPVHHRAGPHLPEPSCLVEPDEVLLADEADGDQLWGGLLYKPHVRLEHPEPEPLAALRLGHADRVDAQGGPLGVVGAHALVGELAGLGQGAVDKPRHALALDGHHEEPPGVRLAGADPSGGCGLVLRVPRRLKRGDHVQVLGLRGAEERLVVCHHLIRHDGCGCGTNSPPLCRPFNRLRLLQALKVARPVLALAAHAGEMETGM
mmetsp:Transcript_24321/g.76625  ORF Transcript_24321/g.76625 Transcript_24321/m.76625 type:complete len:280 (+) Transcript_24321:1816-2655(+)